MMGDKRKDDAKTNQPFTPGDKARQHGEIPTGQNRNDEYGQGRTSGAGADDKEHDKAQVAELEMNEENR